MPTRGGSVPPSDLGDHLAAEPCPIDLTQALAEVSAPVVAGQPRGHVAAATHYQYHGPLDNLDGGRRHQATQRQQPLPFTPTHRQRQTEPKFAEAAIDGRVCD